MASATPHGQGNGTASNRRREIAIHDRIYTMQHCIFQSGDDWDCLSHGE